MALDSGLQAAAALLQRGELTLAMRAAAQLRQRYPQSAAAQQLSGDIALRRFDWEVAERFYLSALQLDPALWSARNNLANIFRYTDRRALATSMTREAVALCPDGAQAARLHSNLITHMHSDPEASQAAIVAEVCAWRVRHLAHLVEQPLPRSPNSDARPLLAIVSGALGSPIFARLLPQVLRRIDRSRYQIELVNTGAPGPIPAAYSGDSLSWISSADAAQLRARGYALALDLDGHSPTGRPALFAQRIAPVQACWLDWFNTTGVPAMDFFLGDAVSTPEADHAFFSERVVNLSQFRLCFDAPHFADPLAFSEPLAAQPVVFGVFGRFDKHNALLYDAWASILRQMPDAAILFKASAFDGNEHRAQVLRSFHSRAIEASRIRFLGSSNYRGHLEAHAGVSLMLDTFPYNGGVSSFDSLYCGVPLVTRMGDHPASRQTAAMLSACKLDQYIATNAQDYVQRAMELAMRPPHTAADIRAQFLASELVDASRFAAALERAFDHMLAPTPASPNVNLRS